MNNKVVDVLNEARASELTAVAQYMAQHYEMDDAGYGKVATRLKEIAIQEMKHAEALAERILFLKGAPTSKPDASARKGEEIPALLKTDVQLETQAMRMYNDAAALCAAEGDVVSGELFRTLLAEEEQHFQYFDSTLRHVEKRGNSYLARLIG